MRFKEQSDLWRPFWAEEGYSAPLPCHRKCSEVIKTPIFPAVLQCWVLHALSLRSSRGYWGQEQCQGQSPLGNVTAQAASTWLPLRAGLADAVLGSLQRKIRLDTFFHPSKVTLPSQEWSVLEWSGKSCVGAAWAAARVGDCAWAMEGLARGSWERRWLQTVCLNWFWAFRQLKYLWSYDCSPSWIHISMPSLARDFGSNFMSIFDNSCEEKSLVPYRE